MGWVEGAQLFALAVGTIAIGALWWAETYQGG